MPFAKTKLQLLYQFEHGTRHVTGLNIIGHQWFLGFEGLISSGGDIYLAFEGLLKRQTTSINGFAATPLRHCGALSTRASAP